MDEEDYKKTGHYKWQRVLIPVCMMIVYGSAVYDNPHPVLIILGIPAAILYIIYLYIGNRGEARSQEAWRAYLREWKREQRVKRQKKKQRKK